MPDQVNPETWPLIVLKIGGSVLTEPRDVRIATHEIYRWIRRGYRVVAVVSARKGRTDQLLAQARDYGADQAALAQLCSTGEHEAAALLGLACDRAGMATAILDARTTGLRTRGEILDSDPVSLNAGAVVAALRRATVAIVPGFIGQNDAGQLTLLGRGGSDLSAIFIASVLGARCRLIKDVPGLFDRDPDEAGAQRYERVSWSTLRGVNGKVIQSKAANCALRYRQCFEIAAPLSDDATTIGGEVTRFAHSEPERRCLDVTLLGAGVVGGGVYQALQDFPDRFRVVSVLTRNIEKAASAGIPRELLRSDPAAALAGECDVVVEAIGGIEIARDCIVHALKAPCDVVTANKAVIAAEWKALSRSRGGAQLAFSAAVGGAVPVIELMRETLAPIVKVEGILNGTTNWILSAIARGMPFEAAVRRAQELGFAEADPTRDLSGQDALDKLQVLAKVVLGIGEVPAALETLTAEVIASRSSASGVLRHVATLEMMGGAWKAGVRLMSLSPEHPLACVCDERNAVTWITAGGDTFSVSGKGAGRWPTTQAVIADLLDVHAACVTAPAACLGVEP